MKKPIKERISRPKLILIVVLVVMLLAIELINFIFYAGVLNLSSVSCLTLAMVVFLTSKFSKRNLVVTALLTFSLSAFCMALILPNYTYSQATELIQSEKPGLLKEDGQKNEAVSISGFSFYEFTRYYRFTIEQEGVEQEYLVNPDSGEIIHLGKR